MIYYIQGLVGVVIFTVIESGITYFLQQSLVIANAYGSTAHYSLILVIIPLLIGCLLRILRTPKKEIAIFLGATFSAIILYFYYQTAWKQPPNILHALSFAFITGTIAYLGAVIPTSITFLHIRKNSRQGRSNEIEPKIFISYRRNDSAAIVGRIYDRLISFYGRDLVFKDVDDIPPGIDFRVHLIQSLQNCDVLLVVIGKNWLNIHNDKGEQRLRDPQDFVRIEIETAIANNMMLIPVLVEMGNMPTLDNLPESISNLKFRQAVFIRDDPDFNTDINKLINKLNEIIN